MKIDLANVAGVPGAQGRYPIEAQVGPIDGVEVIGPVTGELAVQNAGRLLVVRGQLHAEIGTTCVRCLVSARVPLSIEVAEEFASVGAGPDVGTIDVEDPERSAMADFVLDVAELARQQVAMNVPMATLCQPDCKGLCPRCGNNLNEGACECPFDTDTSPFSQLRELLDEGPDRR